MKFSKSILILSVLLVAVSFRNVAIALETPATETTKWRETKLTPFLQETIIPGTTLVYCAAFQAAWNEIVDNVIKEELPLVADAPSSNKLHDRLVTKKDLPAGQFMMLAGTKKEGIESKFNDEYKKRFSKDPWVKSVLADPLDILAYAAFSKEITFSEKFERYRDPVIFKGKAVQAFGIKQVKNQKRMIEQVKVYDYLDTDNFVIGLKTSEGEELLLAKIPFQESLQKVIESVYDRIKSDKPFTLQKEDSLLVPVMEFNVHHHYTQLEAPFSPSERTGYYWLKTAAADVSFKLNQDAAFLASDSAISAQKSQGGGPKTFVFDKPFLMFLKLKEAKYPYLALWVDSTEIMKEAK